MTSIASDVVTGDFDGDGFTEIMVVDENYGGLYDLRRNGDDLLFHAIQTCPEIKYTPELNLFPGDYNGDGYIVVPYRGDEENPNSIMEIGYITKKNSVMSKIGVKYLEEIDKALAQIDKSVIYED